MTDLTQRIINALRRAVISARNADEAAEAGALADSLAAEGAPITAVFDVPTPVVEMTAEPAPMPSFAAAPPVASEPIREGDAQQTPIT